MTAPLAPSSPAPSFIRPALGLLAGLGITALIVGPGIVIATLAMLRGVADPRAFRAAPEHLAVYLVIIAVGAFAGGLATARITVGRSFYTVFLMALVLFTSAMVFVLRGGESAQAEPRWFTWARAITVLVAALLGGFLERRRQASQ